MDQFTLEEVLSDEDKDAESLGYEKRTEYVTDEATGETALITRNSRALKKPRGTYVQIQTRFDAEDYHKFLREVISIGLSVKSRRADDMKQGFIRYLQLCKEQNRVVTNQCAYTAMGINRQIAYDFEHGRGASTPEQKQLIQFVKSVCATYRESMMLTGDLNPIVGIFWQKAFDGLNEMDEVQAVAQDINDYSPDQDADTIAEKYDALPD